MHQYPLPPGLTGTQQELASGLGGIFETLSAQTLTEPQRAWIEEQNNLTDTLLQPIEIDEEKLRKLLTYPIIDPPAYTSTHSITKQHHDTSRQPDFLLTDLQTGETRMLLDTTELSKENLVVGSYAISPDMHYAAFCITPHGSDTGSIRILDVSTGLFQENSINGIHDPEVAVANDGVYYSETMNGKRVVKRHSLIGNQEEDQTVYEQDTDEYHWIKAHKVSPDNTWIAMTDYHHMTDNNYGHDIIIRHTDHTTPREIRIPAEKIGTISKTLFVNNTLYILSSSRDYPMGVLQQFELDNDDDQGHIVVEGGEKQLANFALSSNGITLLYNPDNRSELYFYDFETQQTEEITLPGVGFISSMTTNPATNEIDILYETMTTPPHRISYIPGETALSSEEENEEKSSVSIVHYEFQGHTIPMYISLPKDTSLEDLHGVFVSGYGGFRLGNGARYNDRAAIVNEYGFAYVDVMLPGNSGRGEVFHEFGMRLNKRNVFDAFKNALQTLQGNNIGTPKNTVIFGRSNGGLLIGAAMNEYPHLFGGAICENPITDVLALGKATSPIQSLELGWLNTEYGNPYEDPTILEYMRTYSPMQNIHARGQDSPYLLILGRIHDDRALPPQSARFAAVHQMTSSHAITLLHMGMESGGHGGYIPLSQKVREEKRILQFVEKVLQ